MNDARVRFLMQPAAVQAFEALIPESAARETLVTAALTEYPDARLAAVYLLEMLCDATKLADSAGTGQTKALTVGPIKIEKAVLDRTAESVKADVFCGRAQALRREYRRAVKGITLATPLHVPERSRP